MTPTIAVTASGVWCADCRVPLVSMQLACAWWGVVLPRVRRGLPPMTRPAGRVLRQRRAWLGSVTSGLQGLGHDVPPRWPPTSRTGCHRRRRDPPPAVPSVRHLRAAVDGDGTPHGAANAITRCSRTSVVARDIHGRGLAIVAAAAQSREVEQLSAREYGWSSHVSASANRLDSTDGWRCLRASEYEEGDIVVGFAGADQGVHQPNAGALCAVGRDGESVAYQA